MCVKKENDSDNLDLINVINLIKSIDKYDKENKIILQCIDHEKNYELLKNKELKDDIHVIVGYNNSLKQVILSKINPDLQLDCDKTIKELYKEMNNCHNSNFNKNFGYSPLGLLNVKTDAKNLFEVVSNYLTLKNKIQ